MTSAAPGRRGNDFFAKYRPRGARGAPKYVILREAIISAIEDGRWKIGDRFPTELELTAMTPYSLGTVQRAIQTLVAEGFVIRKHRSGSIVAPGHKRIGGPWLFRFLAEDGSGFLPMFTKVTSRRKVVESGPWFDWLTQGVVGKPLLRIDRKIRVGTEIVAFNRVYLDPEAYPFIATAPIRELDGANIVHLIQEACHLPVSNIAHMARCAVLPEVACRAIGLRRGALGMIVEIAASAGRVRPVSYQQIFVPPTGIPLYVSESSADWHTAGAAQTRLGAPLASPNREPPRPA
ncbi:MAG TPA: GntR family transcriptional regulator [Casimicrobiaceae bacterium]|nr:GntR family transcriptional regulator [Casimicrobiaceae bacterium]